MAQERPTSRTAQVPRAFSDMITLPQFPGREAVVKLLDLLAQAEPNPVDVVNPVGAAGTVINKLDATKAISKAIRELPSDLFSKLQHYLISSQSGSREAIVRDMLNRPELRLDIQKILREGIPESFPVFRGSQSGEALNAPARFMGPEIDVRAPRSFSLAPSEAAKFSGYFRPNIQTGIANLSDIIFPGHAGELEVVLDPRMLQNLRRLVK